MGSGGYRWGKRHALADDCFHLSAKDLRNAIYYSSPDGPIPLTVQAGEQREKLFIRAYAGENDLHVLHVEHRRSENMQQVRVSETEPYFGGVRYWLHCPKCGRRVFQLYCHPDIYQHGTNPEALVFWCRTCLDLSYASKNTKRAFLIGQRHCMRIKARLGDTSGAWFNVGLKPRGMRWSTYERILEEFKAACEFAEPGSSRKSLSPLDFVDQMRQVNPNFSLRRTQASQRRLRRISRRSLRPL